MPSCQQLLWLTLWTIPFSQGASFVEFLAPQQDEVVTANSIYMVKWATGPSTGRGTMMLLSGEMVDSLNELWEIAYSIDVASGNFSWPVGSPTRGTSLSNFYSLNFSRDGSDGEFTTSPPFRILSSDGHNASDSSVTDKSNIDNIVNHKDDNDLEDGRHEDDHVDDGDDDDDHNTRDYSQLRPWLSEVTSLMPNPTSTATRNTVLVSTMSTSLNRSEYTPKKTTSEPSSSNTAPAILSSASARGLSSGIIIGIVTGPVLSLAIIGILVWFTLHYRRKSLGKNKLSGSGNHRISEIDGRYRKAELDAEGPELRVSRMYELNATRDIQEADGNEKPVELDSVMLTPKMPAVDAKQNTVRIDTAGGSVSRLKKGDIVTDWASY
ncbi:hypothetical protein GGR51DRAFT_520918 [Nemania sp. FL0031]|nr:hypothetical protein GGR51DRAFT_520918 [Nemania sp. FL0031]